MTLTSIPVVFDKSHLSVLGGRLYSQSLDLVRELVANAWDADSKKVKISLFDKSLVVEDDGAGMDQVDLRQYFTIGSNYKKTNPLTDKFKRVRIGEFGIGKFAPLALCDRFELYTKKNDFAATVIFDKNDFEASARWEVPVIVHKSTGSANGTKVTLTNLKMPINPIELERRLRQQLPLREKDFEVYIDSVRLAPRFLPGRKFIVREKTAFGPVSGQIIISALLLPKEEKGIAVRVKGMMVKRLWFGLDKTHEGFSSRITGEINADFLTLTSGRDNFIKSSKEYNEFVKIMAKKAKKISLELRKRRRLIKDKKESRALSEALQNIRRALKKNADIFLLNDLPLFKKESESEKSELLRKAVAEGVAAVNLGSSKVTSGAKKAKVGHLKGEITRKMSKEVRNRVKTVLRDRERLVKRIKIGGSHIVCSFTSLGEEEIESFNEGGVVFINRDHPLFLYAASDERSMKWHLARLITQEIALLAKPASAYQAFEWQSRLLKDALTGLDK